MSRALPLFALVLLLPACRREEPPSTPTPEAELGVPEEYDGPIDPRLPPSHAANLEVELEAAGILKARRSAGEEVTQVRGEPLIEGDHPGIYAQSGRIGDFDYIEVVLGHVDDPHQELPLVVLLHGRGDHPRIPGAGIGQDFPIRAFIPRAPDPLGDDGFTWLATWTRSDNQELLVRSLAGRVDELAPAIEAFRELRPTRGKPVLVGFSQGAIMSWGLWARYPERFEAAFPIAGWLPPALIPERVEPGVEYPHIHALHGTADETVPIEGDRRSVEALRALGITVGFTEVPGVEHRVTPEMSQLVRGWVRDALFPKSGIVNNDPLGSLMER